MSARDSGEALDSCLRFRYPLVMGLKSFTFVVVVMFCTSAILSAEPAPYIDPSQLDCPFPKHSFYKQPWRGFLETRSGADFVQGIGINYNISENDEVCVRLLAETGFKRFRIEMGWGSVNWEENAIGGSERLVRLLKLCKQHGVRPTMLLNAHHGAPCPMKTFERKLAADAPLGATSVKLTDVKDLVVGRSGIDKLTDYCAAEVIFTSIEEKTGECKLSRPLPKELKADKPISVTVLKFAPLYPVGTKEFEETTGGWLRYADIVCKLVRKGGIDEFDVEIWNELSFGSKFTRIDNYYEPEPFKDAPDFLNKGGRDWEMARRTVEQVRREYPKAHCIWGFSNTTFYHCPVEKLPPGMAGQSYHPYGTGTRKYPQDEPHKDHPDFNLEGYTPTMETRLPEGWAFNFLQTEGIMRLLNPVDRKKHPQDSERFYHYITEHGVMPAECNVTEAAAAWDLKSKCALRSYCFWMNKGIHGLYYFCAKSEKEIEFGLLPVNAEKVPKDAKFDDVATPPMKAVRNLVKCFEGSQPMKGADAPELRVEAKELGEPRKIFDGDGKHPPLFERDVLAVLPFRVSAKQLAIPVYVVTYDINKKTPDRVYRLKLSNLGGRLAKVTCGDAITGTPVEVKVLKQGDGDVELEMPVTDYPRVVMIKFP